MWATGETDDGLRVIAVRIPGARALGVSLAIEGGFASERAGEAGRAHLVEHLLHHGACGPDGRSVDLRVRRAGGVTSAQSYPFHTEYSLLVPLEDAQTAGEWTALARARLDPLRVTDVDVERESALVRREVAERRARSPLAGFPWSTALATLGDSHELAHDGLADLTGLDGVTPAVLAAFHDARRSPTQSAIGLAADADPDVLLSLAGATPRPLPQPRPALAGVTTTSRSVHLARTRLTDAVAADVRRVAIPDDASRFRGLLMLATGVASATTERRWQSGLFGPLLGADPGLVVTTHGASSSSLRAPSSRTLAQERREAVADARARALRSIDEYLTSTGAASALAARDALSGLDVLRSRDAVRHVTPDEVCDLIDHVEALTAGRLVWHPESPAGAVGARGSQLTEEAA